MLRATSSKRMVSFAGGLMFAHWLASRIPANNVDVDVEDNDEHHDDDKKGT